jgi:membrane protease YdiL (CAAX protease family)
MSRLNPAYDSATSTGAGLDVWIYLAYWALFMAYNGIVRETEAMHWPSLVLVPFALVYLRTRRSAGRGPREALARVGLERGNLRRGLALAVTVGLALGALQLLVSNKRAEFLPMLRSGRALIALPLVIGMLAATAGFTEEFFFRGVLQTALARAWGREIGPAAVAAALFGLYHFPYVFSRSGHVGASLTECGLDTVAGFVIGCVYVRARHNLLAAVTVHVLIDALPAMTMVRFGP